MIRLMKATALLPLLLLLAPPALAAPPVAVTSTQLLTHATAYDGKRVTFEGQVVGSPIRRKNSTWLTISNDGNALGVLVPDAQAAKVQHFGNYEGTGDRVAVTGTFYRTDPLEQGETDIRAGAVTVLSAGHPVSHPVPQLLWVAASISCALAAGLWLLSRLRSRQEEA